MCGISCVLEINGQHLLPTGTNDESEFKNQVSSVPVASADAGEREKLSKSLEDSLDKIKHRGPDSRGQWISPDNRVGMS